MEKISVIILTKNNEKYICRCINSILMQKYPNYEIIVVDSNSTDNTLNILQQYNIPTITIKLITSEKTISIGKARQIGLDNANSEILAYIDSDVELPNSEWLENMAIPLLSGYNSSGNFLSKERIAGVQTLAKNKDNDPLLLKLLHKRFEYKNLIIDNEHYQMIGTSHLLIRKKLIQDVDGFKDVMSAEDTKLIDKIIKNGYSFIYLRDQKCYHYHVDSFSHLIKKSLRDLRSRIRRTIYGEDRLERK